MTFRHRFIAAIFTFVTIFAALGASTAHARDVDYDNLVASLDRVASDPKLAPLVPMQIDRARVAVQAYKDGGRSDRPYLLYVAQRRIDIARTGAEAVLAENERADLQRENDRLQLDAARRDAAQARAELERQRLQSQIRAEEAERLARDAETARAEGEHATQAAEAARAEAAQSRRIADAQAKAAALAKKEAELATGGSAAPAPAAAAVPKQRMTLNESAFARGQSTLADAGSARIGAVVDFINASPGSRVRIEASARGDQPLATARAQTVRDALVAAGVAASRIHAAGVKAKGAVVDIRLEGAD
jgi:outer membrane protein OmpA-like peptidoglycan-associated protein